MKKLTILFLISLCFANVNAQEIINHKSSIQLGLNGAFYGSGDLIGPSLNGEFVHDINNFLAASGRIFGGFGNKYSQYEDLVFYDQISSFGINMSLRFTPLPDYFNRLKIEAGPLFHKVVSSYGETSDNPYYQPSTYSYHNNENLFGISGSLLMDVYYTDMTTAGLRFDMLTSFTEGYYNCDSFQLGVYYRVKL